MSCQQNANQVARAAARCGIPRQVSQAAGARGTRRNAADRVIRRLQDPGVYVSAAEVKRAWPGASPAQRDMLRRLAPVKTRLAACPAPAGGGSDEPGHEESILDLRGVFR